MPARDGKNGNKIFALGVGSISLLVGILTGSSPSPVAGTLISAALGLVVAGLTAAASGETSKLKEAAVRSIRRSPPEGAAAAFRELMTELESQKKVARGSAGGLLLLVAFTVAIGIGLGAFSRIYHFPSRPSSELPLPWKGSKPPTITFNAVDWLVLQQVLVEHGYSTDQVASLYRIQAKEWARSGSEQPPQDGLVVKYRPLSELVGGFSEKPEGQKTGFGFVAYQETGAMKPGT